MQMVAAPPPTLLLPSAPLPPTHTHTLPPSAHIKEESIQYMGSFKRASTIQGRTLPCILIMSRNLLLKEYIVLEKKSKMQQVSFEKIEENHFLSALIPFCGRLQQLFCLARWSFLHLFCANFKEGVFYCPSTCFFVRSYAILRSSVSCTSSRNTCEAISHVCSSTKPSKSTCDVRKY